MYKIKRSCEIDKNAKINHNIVIGIECIMSIVSLGMMIYYLVIGDPNNRFMSAIYAILAFLAPFFIEIIFKIRFAPIAHAILFMQITLSVFLGSCIGFHSSVEPYDEIMHFLLGYNSCMMFYYFFLAWKDNKRQSPIMMAGLILVLGIAISSIWELFEFCTDLFLDQTSLGAPYDEVVAAGTALGYTGVRLNIFVLTYGVPIWDTITDMAIHLFGSTLFFVQYLIHRKVKKPLMLTYIARDYYTNKNAFYEYIGPKDGNEDISSIEMHKVYNNIPMQYVSDDVKI